MNKNTEQQVKILFEWQEMSLSELTELTKDLSIKNLRWLAMIHPDNRTRENLLRLSHMEIGEKTVINIGFNTYDNSENMVAIGARCAIAANVSLIVESGPNMSRLSEFEYPKKKLIQRGKIIIEDDAWIGANAIVFPGVRIGHHSIVGAGSIVNKDIPPFSIAVGQPVKISPRKLK